MATTNKGPKPKWTFLTNHSHVLVCLMEDPELRGRDIAEKVGITERATQKIISDLVEEGFLKRKRIGRRNHYELKVDKRLRHPLEKHKTLRDLMEAVSGKI